MKKIISIVLFNLCIIFFISCDTNERDVYKLIPKGSELDMDVLRNSKQFFFNDSDLVLVNDISDDWDIKNNHLLFYNKLKLYGAEYLPAQKVESIKGNVISIIKNTKLESKSNSFVNDAPNKYSYNTIEPKKISGNQRIGNKIIERILINPNRDSVKVDVLCSDDLHTGLRGSKVLADSTLLEKFDKRKQLTFAISDLIINYDESIIRVDSLSHNGTLVRDNMLIRSSDVVNDLYKQIIKELKGINKQ